MLTAEDLKEIRVLIREEIGGAIARDVSPVFVEIFRRFDEIDNRFVGVDDRFSRFDDRFGRLEALMVTKDYLDDKLADLRGEMNLRFREHEKRFDRLEGRFTHRGGEIRPID